MKRILILLAMSGLAVACSDDDNPSPSPGDAGPDAAIKPDSGMDGAMVTVKVTNAGAECSAVSQCMGAAAQCGTNTPVGDPFPGGYCTASCLSAAECGPDGDCPLGELVSSLGVGNPLLMGIAAGQCWEKCTTLNTQSTCRTGYVCTNLATALGRPASLPVLARPVCLPLPRGDGGAGDAGNTVDASGIDGSL